MNLNAQVVKTSRQSIIFEDKMEVSCRKKVGEGQPSICKVLILPSSTVTTIMKIAYKIKSSVQQTKRVSSAQLRYSRVANGEVIYIVSG